MKRITFKWTACEDYSKPNNNYCSESDYIDVDSDFGDYLISCGESYEREGSTYYITYEGIRTGEAYLVIDVSELNDSESID